MQMAGAVAQSSWLVTIVTVVLFMRCIMHLPVSFFFNATATTEIYTLSLHDALPIYSAPTVAETCTVSETEPTSIVMSIVRDRKSTRLNSSHRCISYAVFCLKKKTNRGSSLTSSVTMT